MGRDTCGPGSWPGVCGRDGGVDGIVVEVEGGRDAKETGGSGGDVGGLVGGDEFGDKNGCLGVWNASGDGGSFRFEEDGDVERTGEGGV